LDVLERVSGERQVDLDRVVLNDLTQIVSNLREPAIGAVLEARHHQLNVSSATSSTRSRRGRPAGSSAYPESDAKSLVRLNQSPRRVLVVIDRHLIDRC
jgi:hypothetical protein